MDKEFAGFDGWDDCIETMTEDEGQDTESAENICGALEAEEKSEHGNVAELKQALASGAGLIADVGVDLVSGVDVPAVDSKWVAMKADSDDHDYRVTTRLLKAEDTDQRITYAAAMIPREPDKEGDVAPTPTVEKAAHNFLKSDGGIDTDHSLIDGEGDPVESWVLKEERTFDLPGGGTETYGEGTWMLGVEWGKEAWDRIQAGELTGLSIYGMAEHVALDKTADCDCPPTTATAKQLDIPLAEEAVVHLVYESKTAAEQASEEIGLDGATHDHEFDGMTVFMPGESHEAFVDRYMELAESFGARTGDTRENGDTHKAQDAESDGMAQDQPSDGDDADTGDSTADGPDIATVAASVDDLSDTVADVTDTIESMKDAVETQKQDAREAASVLAEEFGLDGPEAVLDAVDAKADDGDDDGEDDDDDDEMEANANGAIAEKRADEANLDKGGNATQTAAKGIDAEGDSGSLSYAALAEEQE